MVDDYYRVLGVDPSADFAAIRKAYRLKAMECHPDRGGSHDRMVVVNAAWEILSDPELRLRYDAARTQATNPSAQAAATADATTARQRAEQYPRRWADFVAWLNGVAGDFSDAQYGSTPLFGDVHFPTVGNSVSGCLFIVVGAALAGFFISTALADFCERNKIKGPIGLVLILGPVIGGRGRASPSTSGWEAKSKRHRSRRRAGANANRSGRRTAPGPIRHRPGAWSRGYSPARNAGRNCACRRSHPNC